MQCVVGSGFCKGMAGTDIQSALEKRRKRKRQEGPSESAVYRALRGESHKRGRSETRGRKPKFSFKHLTAIDRTRLDLIRKVDGDHEARSPFCCKHVAA